MTDTDTDRASKSRPGAAGRLSLQTALLALDRVLGTAKEQGCNISFVLVDNGGLLVSCARMDNAAPLTMDIALGKARTSALSHHPTSLWMEACREKLNLLTLPGVVAAGGGLPIVHEGRVIGAVGVSGASDEQDEALAHLACVMLEG